MAKPGFDVTKLTEGLDQARPVVRSAQANFGDTESVRVILSTRVPADDMYQLKELAARKRVLVQDLVVEALRDLFQKYPS